MDGKSSLPNPPDLPATALCEETEKIRVIRLEDFEAAFPRDGDSSEEMMRRFAVLLDEGGPMRSGGLGRVRRVRNAWGEPFALKTLSAKGADSEAFLREYRLQCRVSGLRGFPKAFGRGVVEGAPAILMEWVEGVTLAHACRMLAVDDEGRMSPLNAARIGRELFDVLSRLELVDGGIVHGDLSCANVMVRTDRLPLGEQADEGAFDLCLVDFGSARLAASAKRGEGSDAAFGSATVEYAAPELLAPSKSGAVSCAADVYAAAGVAFRLATGRHPFALVPGSDRDQAAAAKRCGVPVELRTAHTSADLSAVLLHEPEVAVDAKIASEGVRPEPSVEEVRTALLQVDSQLDPLLVACFGADPAKRPCAARMRDALGSFAFNYAENVARALRGEPLVPCVPGSLADGYGAALRVRRKMLRAMGEAACVAVAVAVSAIAALLAVSVPLAFSVGGALASGPGAAAVAGGISLLPCATGLLLRWRDDGGAAALVRSGLGAIAGALLSAAALLALAPAGSDLAALLVCAAGCSALCSWCFALVGRLLPKDHGRRRRKGSARGLRSGSGAVLPDGEGVALERAGGMKEIEGRGF